MENGFLSGLYFPVTSITHQLETAMHRPKLIKPVKLLPISFLLMVSLAQAGDNESADATLERGRYVLTISGCNDCHTAGFAVSEGNVLSEDQWVTAAKTLVRRPPMPWFNLNQTSEDDLRAMYQFIRSLGEPGEPGRAYIPPDQEPPPPYATFPAPPPAESE
jgi:mono/diheme cytochrome c family protein